MLHHIYNHADNISFGMIEYIIILSYMYVIFEMQLNVIEFNLILK